MKSKRKFVLPISKLLLFSAVAALSIGYVPGVAQAAIAPLDLGVASTYGVLAYSTITNANSGSVTGTAGADVGIHGATGPTGTLTYAGSLYLSPTSDTALAAATSALSIDRGGTLIGAELAGTTLTPGAYHYASGLGITGTLTLDAQGDANAVFVIRGGSTLGTAVGSSVALINGAQACNVYWQIGSSATLGANSTMVGHLIAYASISTETNTTINGQLLATTGAITLGGSTIVNNNCTAPVVVTTTTSVSTQVYIPPVYVAPGTLHVIKKVVNTQLGMATASSFLIHVTNGGVEMKGSPAAGVGGIGSSYTLPPGTYLLYETPATGYRGVWSGSISAGGEVIVHSGESVTVTRTNFDYGNAVIPHAIAVPDTSVATPPVTPTPTTNGGKLPNTGAPWGNSLLLGGSLILLGGIGFGARKYIHN